MKRLRLCYRMTVFVLSTLYLWARFEFELLVLRRDRLATINKWVPRWSRFNLGVFGVEIDTAGPYADRGELYPGAEPGQTGHIFVANHSSGMDIPVLFTVAETHVISRHDLATWPLLGRSAKRIGTLFVDRASRRSGASVLREVDAALQRGEGIAMFPEGTAYDGDEVHDFRAGAFNAARRAGAEIIPLGIAYGNDAAYYSGLPFLRHMTRIAYEPQIRVAVTIGAPLTVDEQSSLEMKELARLRVQELVDRSRLRLEGSA